MRAATSDRLAAVSMKRSTECSTMYGVGRVIQLIRAICRQIAGSGDSERAPGPALPGDAPLLPTPYRLGPRDEPVLLHRGKARLAQQGVTVAEGEATLSLIWLPHPSVRFEVVDAPPLAVATGRAQLELVDFYPRVFVPALVGHVQFGGRSQIAGNLTDRVALGDGASVDSVSFLLANTPPMLGEWISGPGAGGWLGRVTLDAAPWRVTLEARRDSHQLVEELRAFGGYAVTHVGKLERLDRHPFPVARARQALDALNLFLSFARGFWTPPLLPAGYDRDTIAWQEWLGRTSSPWRANFAWYSSRRPVALAEAFPLFMGRWNDPRWRDSLTLGIWWYLEANGPATAETSVLLSQTALELFGWVILVEERGQMSRNAYRNGRAEENIRALLQWAQVPLALPAELDALRQYAATQGWSDGPEALIRLRNRLTHPGGKTSSIFAAPITARVELRELALWYVELILLRFHGYRGDYVNRHKGGSSRGRRTRPMGLDTSRVFQWLEGGSRARQATFLRT
jgi:hypothetical protein